MKKATLILAALLVGGGIAVSIGINYFDDPKPLSKPETAVTPPVSREANFDTDHVLRIDVKQSDVRIKSEDPQFMIEEIIRKLGDGSLEGIEFNFTKESPARGGDRFVYFRQIIDGVPVNKDSRVRLGRDGNVKKASILAFAEYPEILVDKDQAWFAAERLMLNELESSSLSFGSSSDNKSGKSLELAYELLPDGKLMPIWEVNLVVSPFDETDLTPDEARALAGGDIGESLTNKLQMLANLNKGGKYKLQVNASNGQAKLVENTLFLFDATVCEHEGSFALGLDNPKAGCEDQPLDLGTFGAVPGFYQVKEVYKSGQCIGSTSDCNDPKYKGPKNIAEDFSDWLGNNAVECCDDLSDVEIMTNSDWGIGDRPGYDPNDRAIDVPKPADNNPGGFRPNVDLGQNQDIIVHETTHKVFHDLNPDLVQSAQNGDEFAKGLLEGLSDTLAALFELSKGGSELDAGKIGEGGLKTARDVRDPKNLNNIDLSPNMEHNNGTVVANLIWRMRQLGAPVADLTDMSVYLMINIDRAAAGGVGVYDVDDLFSILDDYQAEPGVNQALRGIFETVWIAMGGNLSGGSSSDNSGGGSGEEDQSDHDFATENSDGPDEPDFPADPCGYFGHDGDCEL